MGHYVSTDTTITSCGDIIVENVDVINGAKLTLDAEGTVRIVRNVTVELGSKIDIKGAVSYGTRTSHPIAASKNHQRQNRQK